MSKEKYNFTKNQLKTCNVYDIQNEFLWTPLENLFDVSEKHYFFEDCHL
jgi:hypothetical protein